MKDRTLFASALLLAGAVLAGFSLLAREDYAVIAGAVLMLWGILSHLGVGALITKYAATFYPKNEADSERDRK